MHPLIIESTKYTPFVSLNDETHHLEIKGESYPENTAEFYSPIFAWLKEYFGQPHSQETTLEMEIIYFNSSSSKVLMDIFDLLDEKTQDGQRIKVNWVYDQENESALEYGEEFQEDLEHLPFHLVVKSPT